MEQTFFQSELEAIAAALADTSEGLTGSEIDHRDHQVHRQCGMLIRRNRIVATGSSEVAVCPKLAKSLFPG